VKLGSEIMEFKGLQTDLSIKSDFTGSLYKISNTRSRDNKVNMPRWFDMVVNMVGDDAAMEVVNRLVLNNN
jgi:hypothetical protein